MFRPVLATSLITQSDVLAELRWDEDATAASTGAVEIYRALVEAHPDVYRPDLATSLTPLGMTLTTQRDFHGALSADRETATTYLVLHSTDSER